YLLFSFEYGGEFMKENMMKFIEPIHTFWTKRTKVQKGVFIGSFTIVLMLMIGVSLITLNSKFVPLYSNLSLQEASQVKGELEVRGIPYEIENGGTTIKVPEEKIDTVIVDLAGQCIPKSGNMEYFLFRENYLLDIIYIEFNLIMYD